MITKQFLTAGHAIFTVTPSAAWVATQMQLGREYHDHYTYRVERVEMKATAKFPAKTCYFVSSLTGPDNTSDYVYLGMIDANTGEVRLTTKSAFPATATRVMIVQRVIAAIFGGRGADIADAGWEVRHCGFCGRCGKLLTVPASVDSGFGPECIQQVMGCTLAGWVKQQKQAAEADRFAVEVETETVA